MSSEAPVTRSELQSLQHDVSSIRDSMAKLASAYTELAVLKERQANHQDANEKAIESLQLQAAAIAARVAALESQAPITKQSSDWVQKAVGLIVAAVIGAAVATNLSPRRDIASPPVIERSK